MKIDLKIIKNIALIALFITAAVFWRLINHQYSFAPNLELVTTMSVLAAIIIGYRAAVIVPLASMVISDMFIGNSSIFAFTWGAFLLIGASALLLRKLNDKPGKQILASLGFAVFSSFAFFAITNFGVWAQGWYPTTLSGLYECFLAAIPFYRTMLVGNIILIPTAVSAWQFAKAKLLVIDTIVR